MRAVVSVVIAPGVDQMTGMAQARKAISRGLLARKKENETEQQEQKPV
jgi:hypothetical protein